MGTTTRATAGILAPEMAEEREQIVALLTKAYWMEIETVINYVSCSINPDGVRAQEVVRSLAEDVQEELGHAKQFGERIKELYGVVPGSMEFQAAQDFLQPPADQRDVAEVIRGVIAAESGAIEHYSDVVAATEEIDPVTNDIVIGILHDEQRHRRLFEGFLREYDDEKRA
jgi:bacterioferritin